MRQSDQVKNMLTRANRLPSADTAIQAPSREPGLILGPGKPLEEIGWTIALHGYRHTYVPDDAGIVGLNTRSEFAGFIEEEQEEKLRSGLGIFEEKGIETDVWIAPAHSFDRTTVRLLAHLGVRRLSDGMFPWPHVDSDGMQWIPQQFWQFRPMSFGVWTVCCHINSWSQDDIDGFAQDIRIYSDKIGVFDEVSELYSGRRANLFDYASSKAYLKALRVREGLGRVKRKLVHR